MINGEKSARDVTDIKPSWANEKQTGHCMGGRKPFFFLLEPALSDRKNKILFT